MTGPACGGGFAASAIDAAEASYSGTAARRRAWLLAMAAATALAALADLMTGPALLSPGDVAAALFRPDGIAASTQIIVRDIRLPMTAMACLVGAALGLAGAIMQAILNNPLASPYTLGFSAAAGFGASLAILTGVALPFAPALTVPAAAVVMSGAAAAMVYGFSSLRGMTAQVMVLAGIATLFLFQSLQSMAQYLASPEVLQAIVFWLFGSLLKANWDQVPVVASVVAASVAFLARDVWRLTALGLGDAHAAALGVDIRRLRIRMFCAVTFLTAGAVAFVGAIGFVGLVAPHVSRMLVGEDQRTLLPMSALTGAFVVAAASVVSKLVSPGGVVPIGIVTAVVGVPFLFGLIVKGRMRGP